MDKIIINGQECDCYANNQIAIQYNSSIFGEVGDLLSGFTYTIHLPITANNERIVELSNIVTAFTKFPYKAHKAIIERDGVQIVSGDLYILSVADDIECSVVFGTNQISELFDKSTKLADVCKSMQGFIWRHSLSEVNRGDDEFPFATYNLDLNETRAGLHPAVSVDSILECAFREYGITVQRDTQLTSKLYVPLLKRQSTDKYEHESQDLYFGNVYGTIPEGGRNILSKYFYTDDENTIYIKLGFNTYTQEANDLINNCQEFVQYYVVASGDQPYATSNSFFPVQRGVSISLEGEYKVQLWCDHISKAENTKFTIEYIEDDWAIGAKSYAKCKNLYEASPAYVQNEGYDASKGKNLYTVTYKFDKEDESQEIFGIKNPWNGDHLSRGRLCMFSLCMDYDVTAKESYFGENKIKVIYKKKHVFLVDDTLESHIPFGTGSRFDDYIHDHEREGYYEVATNLPDMSFCDFLQGVMNLTGQIASVVDGTLVLRTIPSALQKNNAIDYGANLLSSRVETAKKVNFAVADAAQKNLFKFKDGFAKAEKWNTSIDIDNKSLDEERTIIDLPFCAYYSDYEAEFPIYSYEDEETDEVDPVTDEKLILHHLVIDETDDAYIAEMYEDSIHGKYLTGKYLHWDTLLDKFYDGYEAIFENAKVITEDFLFSPIELKQIDLTVPIYLDKYNSYFLINKLTTKENNVCEAELIKI